MQFSKIPDHQHLKTQLLETVHKKRLSHCLLFEGPEGNGALQMSIALAQYILCLNPSENDSCGVCTNCRQVSSFNYPDLHYVFPVAKTSKSSDKPVSTDFLQEWNEILADQKFFNLYGWLNKLEIENKQAQISVHESAALLRKMTLKSYSGKYKIVIIWLPERMNNSAANKLLKLLEEPPQDTLFFMVSNDADALLQTILSRSQRIYVPKFSNHAVSLYLSENENLTVSAATVIANMAQGNLANAITLLKHAEVYEDYAKLFSRLMRNCFKADLKNMLDWAEECGRFEREKIKNLLLFCLTAIQDSLGISYRQPSDLDKIFNEIHFELPKFAPFIHSKNAPRILENIDSAIYDVSRNVNPRLVLMDLSMEMARLLRIKDS